MSFALSTLTEITLCFKCSLWNVKWFYFDRNSDLLSQDNVSTKHPLHHVLRLFHKTLNYGGNNILEKETERDAINAGISRWYIIFLNTKMKSRICEGTKHFLWHCKENSIRLHSPAACYRESWCTDSSRLWSISCRRSSHPLSGRCYEHMLVDESFCAMNS